MRFFKSFKLLHRRTTSDPTNAINSVFPKHRKTASICNEISPAALALAAGVHPSPHPYLRILDLEAENTRLREVSSASLKELSDTKSLLQATQADLYAELHRGVRQQKEDRAEIERLRETLTQYERFLELVIAAEPNGTSLVNTRASLRDGQNLDQALSSAMERAVTSANPPAADPVFSALGPRTQDEYMSALQLTLNSRMQLRTCKKIAKFWKNTAKKDGNHSHVITPSPSAISSIHEAIPAERLRAVNELIARRRASAESTFSDLVPTPTRDNKVTVKLSHQLPHVSQLASPQSLPHTRPCLSPLASQSLRKELGQIAPPNRLSKWSYASTVSRKPLSDVNPDRKTSQLTHSQPTSSAPALQNRKSKAGIVLSGPKIARPRKANKDDITASSDPSGPDSAGRQQAQDRPAATPNTREVSLASGDSVPSHSLSSITEESDLVCLSNSSSDDTSHEWVTCDHKDTSFNSADETLTHTPPSTPSPSKSEISKSRLPVPVFRSLRRLSSKQPSAAKGKTEPNPLVNTAAAKASPSPTRLPVRSNVKLR